MLIYLNLYTSLAKKPTSASCYTVHPVCKLVVMTNSDASGQGQSQKLLFGGPICVANLLVYTNFHTHTQTHASIHIQKKLVSFIINP